MMRAFGIGGRVGPIIFCPKSVLSLLGVIAATLGYDLAVVEEGPSTHKSTDAQSDVQFRPTINIHLCISI